MSYERAGSEEIIPMRTSAATPKRVNRMTTPSPSVQEQTPDQGIYFVRPSGLLNPELIHARERVRIFGLKGVPTIEIRPGNPRRREMTSVSLKRRGAEFKTEKFESVLCDKRLEHWNVQTGLLHMEEQIPALA